MSILYWEYKYKKDECEHPGWEGFWEYAQVLHKVVWAPGSGCFVAEDREDGEVFECTPETDWHEYGPGKHWRFIEPAVRPVEGEERPPKKTINIGWDPYDLG